ncbi:non-ribosomal peptide synthetase [Pseudonocardia acaciae]|uniref:non-ribosomal peptide synthetase n=1 Tax=Pseudonocardia acaciae TaxID=551276 RepID=UPI000688CD3B|nr:amino acid adenylation domain-containing protein [Pseudonocardia acaciae]
MAGSWGEPFPLTALQQAYVVGRGDGLELGNVSTHQCIVVEGPLDVDRLESACRRLVERHDALRLVIDPDSATQRVGPVPPAPLVERVDLTRAGDRELDALWERLSHEVIPLDGRPLFHLVAALLPGGVTRLFVSVDALVMDGASLQRLIDEAAVLYRDPGAELPECGIGFAEYARLAAGQRAPVEHERYWERRLATLPRAPALPAGRPAAEVRRPRFTRRLQRVPAEDWARLRKRAAAHRLMPVGLLVSVFAEVLVRWSREPHLLLNVPRGGRRTGLHPGVGELVGPLSTFSLLEVDHRDERSTFAERAAALQRRLWTDVEHGGVDGVDVLRGLARARGELGTALAPVVFTSMLSWGGGEPAWSGLARRVGGVAQTPQVGLDLRANLDGGGLVLEWDSVDELYAPGLVDELRSAFGAALDALGADDEAWRRAELVRVPEAMLARRAAPEPDPPPGPATLTELVERALRADRSEPAVVCGDTTLSYAELGERAARVASGLRARGVGPGDTVAVLLPPGVPRLLAVLGTVLAGAAYLPIDPAAPAPRVAAVLRAGSPRLVVSDADELPQGRGFEPVRPDPGDPAYVLFTSGSTGRPKGVEVGHRGVVCCLLATVRRWGIGPGDRVLGVTALHHDMSVFDVFGTLAAGATLVLPEAEADRDAVAWAELVRTRGITVWNSVPAMMRMTLDVAAPGDLASLRLVFLGGDWIPRSLVRELAGAVGLVTIVSVGGPTETTLWNIWARVDPDADGPVPYGRPIPGNGYRILDHRGHDRPDLVPGRMYCVGAGVALGYRGDAALTAESFVDIDAAGGGRVRAFRTGDLGRYLPDGTIEFVGRTDAIVKVRGMRIEPGEVEGVLTRHPEVTAAVVLPVGGAEDDPSHDGLAAVLTVRGRVEDDELAGHVRRELPEHMVPRAWVRVPTVPLNANGKPDRAELAALVSERRASPRVRGLRGRAPALLRLVTWAYGEALGRPVRPDEDVLVAGAGPAALRRVASELRELLPGVRVSEDDVAAGDAVGTCERLLDGRGNAERVAAVAVKVIEMSENEVDAMLAGTGDV